METLESTARPKVELSYADAYFANRLYASAWDAAPQEERAKALRQAELYVDAAFEFRPSAYTIEPSGAIRWHERVLAAVCEEALSILQRDPAQVPSALTHGIASASVANLSVVFDSEFVAPTLCKAAERLVGNLGIPQTGSNDFASTPLAF